MSSPDSAEGLAAGAAALPRPTRWPWLVLAVFVTIAAVAMILVSINDESLGEQIPYVIAFSMFGVVGALIASRDRGNRIGLILLMASFLTALSFLSFEVLTYSLVRGQSGWWVVPSALANSTGWLFGILPAIFFLPLLFPDGHVASPRWRVLLWIINVFLAVVAINLLFGQETISGSTDAYKIANPFYMDAAGSIPVDALIAIMFPAVFGAGIASLIVRFRRAQGVERQQIKWVAFGLGLALMIIFSSSSAQEESVLTAWINGAGFMLFPISIGIAVLRFHLYDLDLVVKKTLIYAAFAVLATAIYLAMVVGVGAWLGRNNSLLTMLAAVVVALTFQPARARLTRLADRMVYGKRATPYEVLSEFSERVGEAYSADDVLPRMARILGEGVGAERADVWLVVDDALRDVAAWPADSEVSGALPITNGAIPPIDGADRAYPVEQAGELLGALTIRKPAADPVSPADEKLIAGLASQAGLVLRNVRLTEELKARLQDLKGAQKRLVSAQDEERRKLERNIHDGAQQQLVALAVKARLARQFTDRDPARVVEMLDQIETEMQQALEDLRDLARGIYPPLLADKGIGAAIEAQARRSPLPVSVGSDVAGRFAREVEAAVYFCVLEALQNAAKYSEASAVTVSFYREADDLVFVVTDDGSGFDPSAIGYGTGLQGIADRLGALEGSMSVASSPGAGTILTGRLPVVELSLPSEDDVSGVVEVQQHVQSVESADA